MMTMFQLGIFSCSVAAKLLFCFSQIGVLSVALDPKTVETAEKSMQKADVNYIKLDNAQLRQQFPMVKVFDNSLALVEPEGGTLYADKGVSSFQECPFCSKIHVYCMLKDLFPLTILVYMSLAMNIFLVQIYIGENLKINSEK